MKIGTAQLNFKIGALERNAQLIIDSSKRFAAKSCRVAVFPELAISGYYPWDLLDQPGFVELQLAQLDRIARETRHLDLDILLGCVTLNHGAGKRYHNSFAHLRAGALVTIGHKQLLPTYNIFDERRHFEPGSHTHVLELGGKRFGILICEDGWNDGGADYAVNPIQDAVDQGADAIISLNASPWQTGKHLSRLALFEATSKRASLPILYVNQVGAHDEIIYDGASFATTAHGVTTWRAGFATTQEAVIDFFDGQFNGDDSAEWPEAIPAQQLSMIELGLRDYMDKCGFSTVVIGSSGGIDSAVTIALAERVLGAANVAAITMPSKYSSDGSVSDSHDLCDRLGIALLHFPIKDGFDAQMAGYQNAFGRAPRRVAIENIQARLRGVTLMTYSNDTGALLLTTGNKSEVSVGFCTLYGDMNGGLNLIGDLYKTEVYALARHINEVDPRGPIPVGIIDKPPSAELFDDQKDSDSLPPYDELDAILRLYIERDLLSEAEVAASFQVLADFATPDTLLVKIMGMVDRAEFKRWQSCPILRLHARAFGTGRRYPIAQGFEPPAYLLRSIRSRVSEDK